MKGILAALATIEYNERVIPNESMVKVWIDLMEEKKLSSPRAKRAGPQGLRTESARAVTGRRCPQSGKGEDFLTGQPDFFTETAVTPERKVKKSFPRSEINRNAKG